MARKVPGQSGTVPASHGAKSTDKWAEGRVSDTFQAKTRVRWFDKRTERFLRTMT